MAGSFFTFPLCLLSMPLPEKEILNHIVCHAIERAGKGRRASGIQMEQVWSYVTKNKTADYNQSEQHDHLIRGAMITNVRIGSLTQTAKQCETAKRFVLINEMKYGTDALVFIATALFWSCRDDTGLSYREFSTACAVNSIIGFKHFPVIVRRKLIITRQLGYKSPAVMLAEQGSTPTRQPLSVMQLRDTLDKLESRDLFRRCQSSPRCVYFSTTLDLEQLRDAVKKRIQTKSKPQLNREADRKLFNNRRGTKGTT